MIETWVEPLSRSPAKLLGQAQDIRELVQSPAERPWLLQNRPGTVGRYSDAKGAVRSAFRAAFRTPNLETGIIRQQREQVIAAGLTGAVLNELRVLPHGSGDWKTGRLLDYWAVPRLLTAEEHVLALRGMVGAYKGPLLAALTPGQEEWAQGIVTHFDAIGERGSLTVDGSDEFELEAMPDLQVYATDTATLAGRLAVFAA